MIWKNGPFLLVGTLLTICLYQQTLFAQACQDEEAMVNDYRKGLIEMIETVKGESLEDFRKSYHQKTCLSRLNLCTGIVDVAIECLKKASEDPEATKEQAKELEAKRLSHNALKTKVGQYSKDLKAAASAKDAKDLIATFDLSN